MKSICLASVCFLVSVSSLLAQTQNQLSPSTSRPQVGVTIFSDGKPTDQKTGIKAAAKEIRFRALLNTKLDESFRDFKSELLIKNTQVLLTRNGRTIAQMNTKDGHLANNLIQNAQPEDHIAFIFTLVAQRKNGELVSLPEQPTYNFPIRE
ncbi:MAG: hypothetical protein EOO61_08265 [Hymenobacter sp.]|nr:MAG: hypothetical protein EOO61_08265 [Hymenobacter sp.]